MQLILFAYISHYSVETDNISRVEIMSRDEALILLAYISPPSAETDAYFLSGYGV